MVQEWVTLQDGEYVVIEISGKDNAWFEAGVYGPSTNVGRSSSAPTKESTPCTHPLTCGSL